MISLVSEHDHALPSVTAAERGCPALRRTPCHIIIPHFHRTSTHGPFHNHGQEIVSRIAPHPCHIIIPHCTAHYHTVLSVTADERGCPAFRRTRCHLVIPHYTAPHLQVANVRSEGGHEGAGRVKHQRHRRSRVSLPAPSVDVRPPPRAHRLANNVSAFQRSQDQAGRRNNQKEIEECGVGGGERGADKGKGRGGEGWGELNRGAKGCKYETYAINTTRYAFTHISGSL